MDDLRGGSKQIAFKNISRGYDFAGKGLVFNNLDAVFLGLYQKRNSTKLPEIL